MQVVRRKAAVVTAVRKGRITLEEALLRYQLTEEEYRAWERAFEQYGVPGLRSTRLQHYRGRCGPRAPQSRRDCRFLVGRSKPAGWQPSP
jgi:hypothetical protein